MNRTFIPLYFDTRSNWYYVRVRGGSTQEQEKPAIRFTSKDNELLDWLEVNVGPTLTETAEVPIRGEGWEIVAGIVGTTLGGKSGVYIDDELLAVQLKCSGVLDDRPEDPMIKMIKDMEVAMASMSARGNLFIDYDSIVGYPKLSVARNSAKVNASTNDILVPKQKSK